MDVTVKEDNGRAAVVAAFAEMDRTNALPRIRRKLDNGMFAEDEPQALLDAQEALQAAILAYRPSEEFDPGLEPVMAQVVAGARSKNPSAIRMLLGPTVRVRLYKAPPPQVPEPDAHVGVNGFAVTIPRGKHMMVPEIVAEILEQSGIQ